MIRSIYALALLIMSFGCLDKEISPFPENPFLGDGDIFTYGEVSFSPAGIERSNLRVKYDSIYDQLSPEQQSLIAGVRLIRLTSQRMTLSVTDKEFSIVENVGDNICYTLVFLVFGQGQTRGNELCVTIE